MSVRFVAARLVCGALLPHGGSSACEAVHEEGRIAALSPHAAAQGAHVGGSVQDVQLRWPQWRVHPRDHAEERALTRMLAAAMLMHMPDIRLRGHAAAAVLHPRDAPDAVQRLVTTSLSHHPLPCAWGIGPTLDAALWASVLAPHGGIHDAGATLQGLHALPLRALPLGPAAWEECARLGLQTFGDIHQCAPEVWAPVVPQLTPLLRQLRGADPRATAQWTLYRVPKEVRIHVMLPCATPDLEALAFPLRRMLAELDLALQHAKRGTRALHWSLELDDGTTREMRVLCVSGQAGQRVDAWLRLTTLQLERMPLVAPVVSLALEPGALVRTGQAQQMSLYAVSQDDVSPAVPLDLVATLRARLGEDAVYGVSCAHALVPEESVTRVDPAAPNDRSQVLHSRRAIKMGRPPWVLAEAVPMKAPRDGTYVLSERIAGPWWRRRTNRDYYVVQDGGSDVWAYRDRYTQQWYRHGFW